MAQDPLRYRPLLIPAVLEKVGFPVAAIVLLAQHRIATPPFVMSMVDWVFAVLFVISFRKLSALEEKTVAVSATAKPRQVGS